MEQATYQTSVMIDISPEGIRFTLNGIDTDLANLLQQAKTFEVKPVEFNSFDSSNVVIESTKRIEFVDKITE